MEEEMQAGGWGYGCPNEADGCVPAGNRAVTCKTYKQEEQDGGNRRRGADAAPSTLQKWLLSKVACARLEPCEEVLGDSSCGFPKVWCVLNLLWDVWLSIKQTELACPLGP